jgi:excisionase family DNA binding protein
MTDEEFGESFLTVAEVAELLRLNQQTVRNWIDAGTLPAIRVGRRVRIKRSDLNRILADGYRGAPPSAPPVEGPSATDFWSGEPVGSLEPGSGRTEDAEATAGDAA